MAQLIAINMHLLNLGFPLYYIVLMSSSNLFNCVSCSVKFTLRAFFNGSPLSRICVDVSILKQLLADEKSSANANILLSSGYNDLHKLADLTDIKSNAYCTFCMPCFYDKMHIFQLASTTNFSFSSEFEDVLFGNSNTIDYYCVIQQMIP